MAYGQAEHNEFVYETAASWDRAGAFEIGASRPDQAWVLSDRDVWYANPYYCGPAQRHPEDDCYGDEEGDQPSQALVSAPSDWVDPFSDMPF